MTTPESPSGAFTTCTECGRVIPSHRMLCDGCRSGRKVVGIEELGEPSAESPAASAADATHGTAGHPFKPTGTLATALRALFSAVILLEGLVLGALLFLEHMSGSLLENPLAYALSDFRDQRQLAVTLGWVETGFLAAIAILFIIWMRRSAGNIPALVPSTGRYGKGWAIGGWFIPFANFVIPKQIVDDLWRSSEPGIDGRSYFRGSQPVHLAVHLWWAAFLVGRLLFILANRAFGSPNPATIRTGARYAIAGTVLTIAGAGLATWVTGTIARRQAAAARDSGRTFADRDATRWYPANLAVAAVAALALVFVGYQAFDVGKTGSAVGDGGRYEGSGISFEYDSDYAGNAVGIDGTGEPNELGGLVLIGRLGEMESGVVMWVASFAMEDADYVAAIDQVISNASAAYGTGTLVARSDPITLTGGPGTYQARSFGFTGGDLVGVGAAAAGGCTDSPYMVVIIWARDGVSAFDRNDPLGQQEMQIVIDILETLDC